MFPIASRVTCVRAAPGVYRLYRHSRRVGEAVTVDNDALYVSHLFTESGRVVASLRGAARWLERTPAPLLSPPPDLQLRTGDRMTSLKTISEKLDAWRRYRAAVRELSQLTDHELNDIGIRRGDIETIVRRSVMRPPA
jgi:uncharacterized protein YjiS (DUF1127 family)